MHLLIFVLAQEPVDIKDLNLTSLCTVGKSTLTFEHEGKAEIKLSVKFGSVEVL